MKHPWVVAEEDQDADGSREMRLTGVGHETRQLRRRKTQVEIGDVRQPKIGAHKPHVVSTGFGAIDGTTLSDTSVVTETLSPHSIVRHAA